ncbi:hypothetical protein JK636_13915 [Clostridium sp. YIM B02515]|uniref:DUF3955 domain-containing protein n=1 Tax=Clostridium rhizosphaerae TaxID=2803861 RepID=A0ABS1TBX2_9CLOT|nr:hypothetical protein [Clostridium rhizosphaerae]MBL4936853.1 hypothetical protein [Clostridium rhizosphaerae]
MNKKYAGYLFFVSGVMWLIAAILNAVISRNYFINKKPFGSTYICLAIVCIGLSIMSISLGIKKMKDR